MTDPYLRTTDIRFKLPFVWRRFPSLVLFIVAFGFLALSANAQAQSAIGSDTAQTGVFLAKLHDPVYPPITRTAGIYGDVHLTLQIRKDGTIQSVEVVSGPPLPPRLHRHGLRG